MLSVEHVTKTYGKFTALEDISLTFTPGVYGLLAPNGAGKTTTLKCCCGILQPDRGEVRVNGCSMRDDPLAAKRQLAYLPDDPALYGYMTGIQYLDFIADVFGVREAARAERVRVYGERFALTEALGQPISSYSHGMKQKLAILAALLHAPKLILMDEPFGALDALTRDHLNEELLKIWQKTKKTVIFVTHSIEEATFLSDRVLVMSARPGRVKEMVEIDLPRPRGEATRNDPKFTEYNKYLRGIIG